MKKIARLYVNRIFNNIEKELKEVSEGALTPQEFLSAVLGIRRIQTLFPSEGWVTDGYVLTLTVGGPNTYLDTEKKLIEVYWISQKWVHEITDPKALEGLEIIKNT